MSGLGDEIMVLEDFAGRDLGTLKHYRSLEASDYPCNMRGVDESSLLGARVLEGGFADVAGPIAAHLMARLKAEGFVGHKSRNVGFTKIYDSAAMAAKAAGDVVKPTPAMNRLAQDVQAQVEQITFAAQNNRTPQALKIQARLHLKANMLRKLSNERESVVNAGQKGYARNVELTKKLDGVVIPQVDAIKAACPNPSVARAELRKIEPADDRRKAAAERAVRYAKLTEVATMLKSNASEQADLSDKIATAVAHGDVNAANQLSKDFVQVAAKSTELKKIRLKQVRLWKVENDKGEFQRAALRRARAGKKALLLELRRRDNGITPEEEHEKNQAIIDARKADMEMARIERRVWGDAKTRMKQMRLMAQRSAPCPELTLPSEVLRWGPPDFTPAAYDAIRATRKRIPGYVGAFDGLEKKSLRCSAC